MRGVASALLAAAVALSHGASHADAEEKRLGAAGVGSLASAVEGGVRGDAWSWGGRVIFGYGLSNPVELRIQAGAAFAAALGFSGATVGNQEGNLFGDLLLVDASAGVRLAGGTWLSSAFARTRAFLELRGGLSLERLSGQILLGPGDMLIARPDATTSLAPLFAGAAGIEHRFGKSVLVALAFEGAFATNGTRHLGATLEMGWAFY